MAEEQDSTRYVALGDSYAAGVGAGNYLDDSECLRSAESYPAIMAAANGLELHLAACPGATTRELTGQLAALSSATDLVTITIGGNDTGFGTGVLECLKPDWWGDCDGALREGERVLREELPTNLDTVFRAIRAGAPDAKVVATGYPRLFSDRDCHIATFFSPGEMTGINSLIDRLNGAIRQRARGAGFGFADFTAVFEGHAVCDRKAWIHNVRFPRLGESFHPTPAGHLAMANAVAPLLLTARDKVSFTEESVAEYALASVTTAALSDAERVAAEQLTGEAALPDLDRDDARGAAAAAGVSDAEVETLKWALLKGGARLTKPEGEAVARNYRTSPAS